MKLAIIGSRNFTDYQLFLTKVNEFIEKYGKPEIIISGGANGADTMAERWAKENQINIMIFHPEWDKYGKKAGILRNSDIVDASTHILAFPSKNGRGTQDSIRKGQKAGKIVEIYYINS